MTENKPEATSWLTAKSKELVKETPPDMTDNPFAFLDD